jgi:hypothetical protein
MNFGEGGFGGMDSAWPAGAAVHVPTARGDRTDGHFSTRYNGTLSANARGGPARSHPVVPSCTKQLRACS